jgi:flavin reductase (DIM6/NTAB) family NADH-FMN oxidoreductase RutF
MTIASRELRDALGLFSTGVCLVTAIDSSGVANALTVNSFASVSLDPPLVLWSLQKDSDVYSLYAQTPNFAIAILTHSQQELSTRYAQKGSHRLDDQHYVAGVNGAPLIVDALVNFECSLESALEGGDHTILLARVTRIVEGPAATPLVFFGGRYRQLQ